MAQQFSAALDNVFGLDGNDEKSEALKEKYGAGLYHTFFNCAFVLRINVRCDT